MLALVLLAEGFCARNELVFTTRWAAEWKQGAKAARTRARKADVLCLGDSVIKYGVLPKVLERRLGRPAYNLALSAGQAPATFFQLRRALEAGARPSTIVLDFDAHHLTKRPEDVARQWPEMASWRDCLDLAWTAGDADLFGALAASKLLGSARARFEVRANLMAALRGEADTQREVVPYFSRNWALNRGAQVMPANPILRAACEGQIGPIPGDWACAPVHAAYVERILRLAESRRIRVVWALAPVVPLVQARRDAAGSEARFDRFVRSIQARHPGLTVLDGRHCGYDWPQFTDLTHLDRTGAVAFSAAVAEALARPSTNRWVALPPYRTPDGEVPVEDLYQSKFALEARAALRR